MPETELLLKAIELQDRFYEGTLTQADILLALKDAFEAGRASPCAECERKDGRVAKLDRIFLAAQEWYGTVRGHLKYNNLGQCVDFGGMKEEAAELVRALDAYHVWAALLPPPDEGKKEFTLYEKGHGHCHSGPCWTNGKCACPCRYCLAFKATYPHLYAESRGEEKPHVCGEGVCAERGRTVLPSLPPSGAGKEKAAPDDGKEK